ncbi:MAG: AMP-binding protein [Limisphaerales bacterium]
MIPLLRLLLRLLFRFRAYGVESLKTPGPVLLLPNHSSWLDWLFLGVCLEDDWKFVTSSTTAQTSWLHRKMMLNRRCFPVDPLSPYSARHMAEFLSGGGRLVLFPEGRISRTGALMKLFDGTGFLLHRTKARVVTAYLRGALRVPCSPHPGWRKWLPAVTAHFSAVLTPPSAEGLPTTQARAKLTRWLRDQMVRQQFEVEMDHGPQTVLEAVVGMARQRPGQVILEDVTMQRLTYRRLLVGTDLLGGALAARLPVGAERVGVLLPNVNAMPVVLLALWAREKVPAILNFSTGTAVMLQCLQLGGIRHVVTSRSFLEKFKLDPRPFTDAGVELLFLEDLRAGIGGGAKLASLLKHTLRPGAGLTQPPEMTQDSDITPAVVLFTSGSEGIPKGVELTHGNLLANARQLVAVMDLVDTDRFFNALPLFHSFGLMAGTLMPLVRGVFVFLYPSPLHYRVIPTAVYNLNATVMFGTNTFLNGYARRAHPYDFRTVRLLIAGAEKTQQATFETYAQKFGVRILEGYGATECSPAITITSPLEPKAGSAGRFLPGMTWRLEPVEGVTEGGRLFVRGPNVMRGYLNADANAHFRAADGWHDTGDIARVDDEGYVFILGRMKRFAKVSGEMVSLTAVEDALAGAFPQFGQRFQAAVLAVPDEDKGEKLIAVSNEPKLTVELVRAAIRTKGLSNLCVPREVRAVKEIPKLGTGKVNHRELATRLQSVESTEAIQPSGRETQS